MHLLRKKRRRKKGAERVYMYLRRRAYKGYYLGPDIALGRQDRGDPQRTVLGWIVDSKSMPEPVRMLSKDQLAQLLAAIEADGHWYYLERLGWSGWSV